MASEYWMTKSVIQNSEALFLDPILSDCFLQSLFHMVNSVTCMNVGTSLEKANKIRM